MSVLEKETRGRRRREESTNGHCLSLFWDLENGTTTRNGAENRWVAAFFSKQYRKLIYWSGNDRSLFLFGSGECFSLFLFFPPVFVDGARCWWRVLCPCVGCSGLWVTVGVTLFYFTSSLSFANVREECNAAWSNYNVRLLKEILDCVLAAKLAKFVRD